MRSEHRPTGSISEVSDHINRIRQDVGERIRISNDVYYMNNSLYNFGSANSLMTNVQFDVVVDEANEPDDRSRRRPAREQPTLSEVWGD